MKISRQMIAALAITTAFATAATAGRAEDVRVVDNTNPAIGLNLSWVFGAGPAVGLRILSTNEKDHAAFSLGFDYMLSAQSLRPTAGVVYLGHDSYLEGSIGYDMNTGSLNYGAGVGTTKTKTKGLPPRFDSNL